MQRILTKKEYYFVKEFINLIQKYNILFSTKENGDMIICTHEKAGDCMSDFLEPPIELGDCFDETELYEILNQTDERIKQIAEEYKEEKIFSQSSTQK